MKNKALILIDFENEWIDKKSKYYVGDISDVIDRTNQLINYCRDKKYKIIFVRHIEPNSKTAFAKGSKNIDIIDQIHKKSKDVLITKYKISPFYKTSLEKKLKRIKQVIVAGILTNLCVRSFIQDAYDRNFEIIVIKDCCVAFDKKTQDFTFKDLKTTRNEIEFLNLKEFPK